MNSKNKRIETRKEIHLINTLWSANSGSETHTLRLFEILSRDADVTLWSQYTIASEIARSFPVKVIDPKRLLFPKSGIFVFVGTYFSYGRWPILTHPSRIIVLYNTSNEDLLTKNLQRLQWPHLPKVEILYASHELEEEFGVPGVVELSPIDLERFSPRLDQYTGTPRAFTVGRLTRDWPDKHFLKDSAFYDVLTDHHIRVRIMGGMSVRERLRTDSNVELLPPLTEEAVEFLRTLDCFYYRTHENWFEPYGRVIFEAMACGIPVVAHRAGGYARYITHGLNGFLFDEEHEALGYILRLRDDLELRRRIQIEARRLAEELYGTEFDRKLRQYYLGDNRESKGLARQTR